MYPAIVFGILFCLTCAAVEPCFAGDVQNVAVDGKVVPLAASVLTPSTQAAGFDMTSLPKIEPYQSGKLTFSDAQNLINRIAANSTSTDCYAKDAKGDLIKDAKGNPTDTCVTIIHLLRWGSSDHSSVMFQKWYVYDPAPLRHAFYFKGPQERFEGTVITGRTHFRFIFIHLNFALNDVHTESFKANLVTHTDDLAHPVNYAIAITKQQTQFFKDVSTLLSMIGVLTTSTTAASASDPEVGYSSVTTFTSSYNPSSIAVSLSNTSAGAAKGQSATLGTQTYTNEGPSWVGLSFAVPITSYKEISYSQTNGTITSSQINQQSIYAVFDLFLPPVEPSWTTVRWVPHPIFGMPIKKQPLHNTTAGLAMGWRWLEPFGSVVFNVQERKSSAETLNNHLVFKGAWGLNISVSDVAKSLKSSSASKTASTTATKAASGQ
jgi:hypothetical protein